MAAVKLFLVVVAFYLDALPSTGVDACSMPVGWRPPLDEEEVLDSEQFLYGRVRRTYQYPADMDSSIYAHLYIAEVDTLCILKGQRAPAIVNITEVGYVPGLCTSTELIPGGMFVILAELVNNRYKAWRTIPAEWNKLQELSLVCGLRKQYPFGLNEQTAGWTCPTPARPDECLDQEYFDRLHGDQNEIPFAEFPEFGGI